MRQVIIYSGEDGYFVAECPSLPGCITQGKTREEAITNIKEAIAGYIAVLQEAIYLYRMKTLMRWSSLYEWLATNLRQGMCQSAPQTRLLSKTAGRQSHDSSS
jgi:predicted RNase H-like HicB family nuclease